MAFLAKREASGKSFYEVIWTDATKGFGKKGRRRASCRHGRHKDAFDALNLTENERAAYTNGAKSRHLRNQLLSGYKKLEKLKEQEAVRAGGYGQGPKRNTPLLQLLELYEQEVVEQVEVRRRRGGGRAGLAPRTLEAIQDWRKRFKKFLKAEGLLGITAGNVSAETLRRYRHHMASATDTKNKSQGYAPTTANKHMQKLKTFLNRFLDEDRDPYFQISERVIRKALKPFPKENKLPIRFQPGELQNFFTELVNWEASLSTVKRTRGGKAQEFQQRTSKAKLSHWFLVLLLTGCRRHEAAALRWEMVDLEHASITFRSKKTGERRLMLIDPRDTVSPLLLEILKTWKKRAEANVDSSPYVLPLSSKAGEPRPIWPEKAWQRFKAHCGLELAIRPKDMRSNWVCYMVALGRPISVTALWAGHSPRILEQHYLAYKSVESEADNLEQAMGIVGLVEAWLESG